MLVQGMHSGTRIYFGVTFHFIPLPFLCFHCNCTLAKGSSRVLRMCWSSETARKPHLKKLCSELSRIQMTSLLETKESLKTPDNWPDMFSLTMDITRYFGQGLLKKRKETESQRENFHWLQWPLNQKLKHRVDILKKIYQLSSNNFSYLLSFPFTLI